jgi:hypothetical protein
VCPLAVRPRDEAVNTPDSDRRSWKKKKVSVSVSVPPLARASTFSIQRTPCPLPTAPVVMGVEEERSSPTSWSRALLDTALVVLSRLVFVTVACFAFFSTTDTSGLDAHGAHRGDAARRLWLLSEPADLAWVVAPEYVGPTHANPMASSRGSELSLSVRRLAAFII